MPLANTHFIGQVCSLQEGKKVEARGRKAEKRHELGLSASFAHYAASATA